MKTLLWTFIKNNTYVELEINRIEIHSKLRLDEIENLKDYWGPKKSQFLRIYTRKYSNLNAHSNQRLKSLYSDIKDILNKQIGIEEVSRRLETTIQSKLWQLSNKETRNGGKLLRTFDSQTFLLLVDTISFFVILKISFE